MIRPLIVWLYFRATLYFTKKYVSTGLEAEGAPRSDFSFKMLWLDEDRNIQQKLYIQQTVGTFWDIFIGSVWHVYPNDHSNL